MRSLSLSLFLFVITTPAFAQEPSGPEGPASASANAEALRARIHDMRINLLVGGDRVRDAESQAVEFYRRKSALLDERYDSNRTEILEKRASYDVALERSLNADDREARQKAMREASALRSDITSLEGEAEDIGNKRKDLSELIQVVESRDRDRERLVAQLETSADYSAGLGYPLGSIGLAPVAEPVVASSPIDDPALVEDLLKRDPVGGRRILFESDPLGYWRVFPLRPPSAVLTKALRFPLPDLPGER